MEKVKIKDENKDENKDESTQTETNNDKDILESNLDSKYITESSHMITTAQATSTTVKTK